MSRHHYRLPDTTVVSLMAALTTWVALLAWSPFHERSSIYLVPLFGACLLVAVSGALLRSARVPAVLVVLAQLLVLGLWLHHRWVGDAGALGGWLPTSESLTRLRELWAAAIEASNSYAAPVPHDVTEFGLLMVVAGSLTAVLVDFLACGLRRAPLAGLPLLAVYTAPVSILDGGVSWLKFAVGAVCFLFLLTAQEAGRLQHWGQQVTGNSRVYDTQSTPVSGRAVWSSARKIGFTATGLAVVVPILVPTLSVGLFDGNGPGGSGDGGVSISNPMVSMKRDLTRGLDVELVRVTTRDPDPRYLRLTVLDSFDGTTWRPSQRRIPKTQRAEGLVTRPPGLSSSVDQKRYLWNIQTTSELDSTWLPAPYPPYSVEVSGDWRYDQRTLDFISAASGRNAKDLSYQVERIDPQPTATQLAFAPPAPADVFGPNTELPNGIPESVVSLAREVTKGARSKFEMARDLQEWFRVGGGFTYSTARAPGNGIDDLVRFLRKGPDGRVGYCEQFASAMAVMGRALGIPSRVAVGFLAPDQVARDTYVYSAHDLHAWPEMYFEGAGWMRFEPTPPDRTGATVPAYTRERVARTQPSSEPSASREVSAGPNRVDRSAAPGAAGTGSGSSGPDATVLLVGVLVAIALLVAAATPRLVREGRRRRRWARATTPAALAETAWAELRDTARDLGVAWDDEVTVRTRARELVRGFGAPGDDDAFARPARRGPGADPGAEDALRRLVQLVERARYSRGLTPDAAQVETVRADVDSCVAALAQGAGSRRRTRARWLPASLWTRRSRTRAAGRVDGMVLGDPGVDHVV